jgi:hypothetical protein
MAQSRLEHHGWGKLCWASLLPPPALKLSFHGVWTIKWRGRKRVIFGLVTASFSRQSCYYSQILGTWVGQTHYLVSPCASVCFVYTRKKVVLWDHYIVYVDEHISFQLWTNWLVFMKSVMKVMPLEATAICTFSFPWSALTTWQMHKYIGQEQY